MKKMLGLLIITGCLAGISSADSLNVRTVGLYSSSGWWGRDVAVSGSYAYVAVDSGLCILDVSVPSNPSMAGCNKTLGFPQAVAVSGNYVYLADAVSGMRIINVADPANAVQTGFFDTQGSAVDVAVVDTIAYVLPYYGLYTVDIRDKAHPDTIGYCGLYLWAEGLAVSGNHVYVADGDSGLVIIDVSNPANPVRVGRLPTPQRAHSVAVSGNIACIADEYAGLRVVDVSDPAHPVETGHLDTLNEAMAVAVSGRFACVTVGWSGFHVIDISDPSHPIKVGHYDHMPMPWSAEGLAVANGRIYIAYSDTGLGIYQGYGPAGVAETPTNERPAHVPQILCSPNPFTTAVTLRYQLAQAGPAGVNVYNLAGQRVRVLAAGWQTVGIHQCVWDGRDSEGQRVSAGLYILRLSSTDGSATRKLVMIN